MNAPHDFTPRVDPRPVPSPMLAAQRGHDGER